MNQKAGGHPIPNRGEYLPCEHPCPVRLRAGQGGGLKYFLENKPIQKGERSLNFILTNKIVVFLKSTESGKHTLTSYPTALDRAFRTNNRSATQAARTLEILSVNAR